MEGAHATKPEEFKGFQRMMVRDEDGVSFFKFQDQKLEPDTTLPKYPGAQQCKFSSAHKPYAALIDDTGVHVVDCSNGKEKMLVVNPDVNAFVFSPLATYLLTCEKFNQKTGEKNLVFWEISSGAEVAQYEWRKFPKDIAKLVHFTPDEQVCAKLAGRNLIDVYRGKDFEKIFV